MTTRTRTTAMRPSLCLLLLLFLTAGHAAAQETAPRADSTAMATAYADDETRALVRLARQHRGTLDDDVFHYTATARQRVSVGIRALRRDRILYRREVASRVDWWRDRPGRVEVLGAREVIPVALSGVRVPDDLRAWAQDFVVRPGDDRLWVSPTEDGFAWHPLIQGGEALYRYAIGDTTIVRLPDEREVRLVELRVTPRERDIRRVSGSFWIDLDSYGIVQAVFRPAREFDLERDLDTLDPGSSDDLDDVPGLLKPIRFDVRYVTVDYGLWDMRWWMPRLMGFEGHVQLGAVRMPIRIELSYSDYTVEADALGFPILPPVVRELAGDPHYTPRPYSYALEVVVPEDTAALLESPYLPGSVFAEGETLISEGELRDLGERVDALPPPPWQVYRPTVTPPWALGQGLLRYNRVEGLSAGARVDWDVTRARLDLTARLGAADLEPRGELGVTLPSRQRSWRLAAYHRLTAVDPAVRPLGLGNSLTALLFGRDDGVYFQASGAEIRVSPDAGRYQIRLYGERQRAVDVESGFSLAHPSGDGAFRPNIAADPADQVGLDLSVGVARGLDPTGFRWGAFLDLTAETGTYTFLRPGLTLTGGAPLPGGLLGALELAGGTTLAGSNADVPVQGLWFLGGPPSLRGFPGGALSGRDFARGRAEIATELPAARVAVFSDVAWAGRFDSWEARDVALAAGVGASFLDGLIRVDLARALQPEPDWRVELYLDALL